MAKVPEIDLGAIKQALKGPAIANIVVPVAELFARDFVPKTLAGVVDEVFHQHNLSDAVKEEFLSSLNRRLSNQVTRTSANMMGHAVTKAIDGIIDGQLGRATVEERTDVAFALAKQAAAQFVAAAERLLAYPCLQEAVVKIKESDHLGDLTAARAERQAGQDRFTESLINVGRLLAGDVPHSEGK